MEASLLRTRRERAGGRAGLGILTGAAHNAAVSEPFLDEVKRYLLWTDADADALREAHQALAPQLSEVIDIHYLRIVEHEDARRVLTGGEPQIARLRRTFETWLHQCFLGPHDHAYLELRSRIGHAHVRIGLPQRYMITSIGIMRSALRPLVESLIAAERRAATHVAIDKVLALDLTIMLEAYQNDTLDKLARNERLATLGQIGASIGHELRNPLGVISSSAYLLRKSVANDARAARHVTKIEHHVELANRSIADLLALVREVPPTLESLPASALVHEAIEAAALPASVRVSVGAADTSVRADRGQTVQALRNLLANAAEAMRGSGAIDVTIEPDGDAVEIHVDDAGPGFTREMLGRAFEPLVTTKSGGVGLGLPLVRRLVERQGGKVRAINRPGGGARLTLRLTAAQNGPGHHP